MHLISKRFPIHAERSEVSHAVLREILRCAQDDISTRRVYTSLEALYTILAFSSCLIPPWADDPPDSHYSPRWSRVHSRSSPWQYP